MKKNRLKSKMIDAKMRKNDTVGFNIELADLMDKYGVDEIEFQHPITPKILRNKDE